MSFEGYESPAKKPKVEVSDSYSDSDSEDWKDPNAELEDWESDDFEIRYRFIEDEETRKEAIRYWTEFNIKGPYDVDFFPKRYTLWPPAVLPVRADAKDPSTYEMMMECADFAVKTHNELNGTEFVLDSVKKANWESGFFYYITLDVKDSSGITKTCRTKVQKNLIDKVFEFFEFFEI